MYRSGIRSRTKWAKVSIMWVSCRRRGPGRRHSQLKGLLTYAKVHTVRPDLLNIIRLRVGNTAFSAERHLRSGLLVGLSLELRTGIEVKGERLASRSGIPRQPRSVVPRLTCKGEADESKRKNSTSKTKHSGVDYLENWKECSVSGISCAL